MKKNKKQAVSKQHIHFISIDLFLGNIMKKKKKKSDTIFYI